MLAISALVVMMLGKPLGLDVPEFVAAAAPALIIGYAFWRSLKLNRQEASANQAPFASVPA
jgi:hypothetical protein